MPHRPYDAAVINALLVGMSWEKAAEAGGISRATLGRRMTDPEFKTALAQANVELHDRSRRAISAAVPHVITTLLRAATDERVSWRDRIKASEIILAHTLGNRVNVSVEEAEPETESPRDMLMEQMRKLREGQGVIDVTEAEQPAIERHRDAG